MSFFFDPKSTNFFKTLITIFLYAPFHPAWTAAIIFFLLSKINIGKQSAVRTPIGKFLIFVINASPTILFLVGFFIITNFGVWSLGSYGYTLNGLIACYTLALPFLGNSLISTIIFSSIIEILIKRKMYIKQLFSRVGLKQ